MNVEAIEGEVREVDEPHAVAIYTEPPRGLAVAEGPEGMIALASRMATALKDIVDRQHLYAEIKGKRYPTVEAWMTIARLDNVVAREARPPVRHDDGSYEAYVELVRLSDGMVVGGASALCGAPDDEPWGGTSPKYGKPALPARAEHARRSMAQTRASSRAFRQHYSWIMALAGYEPTPADEMPRDDAHQPAQDAPPRAAPRQLNAEGGLVGKATTKGNQDYERRESPDGPVLPFRVGPQIVVAHGEDAVAKLQLMRDAVLGQTVTVWGPQSDESFVDKKSGRTVSYTVLHLQRIKAPEFEWPAQLNGGPALFDAEDDAALAKAGV